MNLDRQVSLISCCCCTTMRAFWLPPFGASYASVSAVLVAGSSAVLVAGSSAVLVAGTSAVLVAGTSDGPGGAGTRAEHSDDANSSILWGILQR